MRATMRTWSSLPAAGPGRIHPDGRSRLVLRTRTSGRPGHGGQRRNARYPLDFDSGSRVGESNSAAENGIEPATAARMSRCGAGWSANVQRLVRHGLNLHGSGIPGNQPGTRRRLIRAGGTNTKAIVCRPAAADELLLGFARLDRLVHQVEDRVLEPTTIPRDLALETLPPCRNETRATPAVSSNSRGGPPERTSRKTPRPVG